LDSAKNKKSFPDFGQSDPSAAGLGGFLAPFGSGKPVQFSMPSVVWENIERDPQVKAEFDKRVEARLQAILHTETAPQRQALFDQAKKEGLEQGIAEGQSKVAESCKYLETIAKRIIEEKQEILRAHEGIWCEAVYHLMKRFLVPLSVEKLKALHDWMESAIGDLERQSKLRVLLSPGLYAQASQLAIPADAPQWEWVEDKSLSDSELRVEIAGGGIFFSPESEWTKFEKLLSDVLGSGHQ
jgi:flagellar biosynthesis/type III secretory pathway protein FliH